MENVSAFYREDECSGAMHALMLRITVCHVIGDEDFWVYRVVIWSFSVCKRPKTDQGNNCQVDADVLRLELG